MPPPTIHLPLFPTGVGSVRHSDAQEAVADVLRQYWRCPFWPQLPRRTPEELMIPQVGLGLPDARWDGDAGVLHWRGDLSDETIDTADIPPPQRAAGLHALLAALEAAPADKRPPVVKGQVVGPLTLATALRDPDGRAAGADLETLMRLARFVGRVAAAQAVRFQRLGAKALIVFDEPQLARVEEPALPIRWKEAVAVLRAAFEPLRRLDALAGLHCCQAANWSRALESRPDLLHFDAREGHVADFLEHTLALRDHVGRGGYLGWGIWPTDRPPERFDAKAVEYHLHEVGRQIAFIDVSVGDLFKRSVLTGVCGTAGLAAADEERLAQDLETLSMGIRRRFWIAATVEDDPDHPLT